MGNLHLPPVLWLCLFLISSSYSSSSDDDIADTHFGPPPQQSISGSLKVTTFKPGITIIVGVLTSIFSITFLLLLYVKHCKRGPYVSSSRGNLPTRNHSGINRKVIESLPMFRFSSLRGQKDGLECAVCLNKFDADEVLRLLPKCKHAFHVECVDTWLDEHSTCPLCRYRVDPEDVLLVVDFRDSRSLFNNQETPCNSDNKGKSEVSPVYVGNTRISGRHSSPTERGRSMEIIVEDPGKVVKGRVSLDSWKSRRKPKDESEQLRRSVSEMVKSGTAENTGRRSLDSWRSFCRKPGNEIRKDGQLLVVQSGDNHRVEHRIIISTGEAEELRQKERWSDVQPSELLYLKSEMIMCERKEEEEEGSGRGVIKERSMSEITGVSRCRSNEIDREGVVMRWLAWISQSPQYNHQKPAVQPPSVV